MSRILSPEGGIRTPFGDQEAVGCDAERHMVVKASPASSFIVTEAKFLLEFLIVALDPPAHFGGCDERLKVGIGRQGRKPVFGRCAFAQRPFDEQPFFGIGLRAPVVAMRGPHSQAGEPGMQSFVDAFAPCDVTPCVGRQRFGELSGRLRLVLLVAPHQGRWPTLTAPCLGRERTGPRRPKLRRRLNADDISQAHARQRRSERRVDPVTGVRQHDPLRYALGACGADLVEGDLGSGANVGGRAIRGLEVTADHLARTAFQISGPVLS